MRDYVPPLGPLRVCSGEDPAIDVVVTGGTNLSRYMETRDESVLTFKPGAKPVWYTLREMPELAYAWVEEAGAATEKLLRTLEVCLVSIENATDATGEQQPGVYTLRTIDQAYIGCAAASRAEFLPFIRPRGVAWELGHLAHWRSELHPKARRVCEMLPGSRRRISAGFSDAETVERLRELKQQTKGNEDASDPTGNATATESDTAGLETP